MVGYSIKGAYLSDSLSHPRCVSLIYLFLLLSLSVSLALFTLHETSLIKYFHLIFRNVKLFGSSR